MMAEEPQPAKRMKLESGQPTGANITCSSTESDISESPAASITVSSVQNEVDGSMESSSNGSKDANVACPDGLNTESGVLPVDKESTKRVNDVSDGHKGTLLCERDVGIIEYVSSHKGFTGVIKQRYADFLVSEINMAGDIVRLTDLSVPVNTEEILAQEPVGVLLPEQQKQLEDLEKSEDQSREVLFEVGEDKVIRRDLHAAIKSNFKYLDSKTVDVDGKKFINVTYGRKQDCRDRNLAWPKERGDYCHFVLYKENKDTLDAVNFLSKLLRIKSSMFTYAGTKDRRAKTSQAMSVFKVQATRLHALNKILRSMTIGNFRYSKEPMKLGHLKGNHFVVIIRNINASKEQIDSGMTSLQNIGFINYFGMQRFGTTDIPTHDIGRAMLKSNWQEAVELILKPRADRQDNLDAARRVWWETRDAHKALDVLQARACVERHLLIGLRKYNRNDLVTALGMIPRNMRLLYIHAFQSRIWNMMVSRRITEFGLKPAVGDLVMKTDETVCQADDSDQLTNSTPSVVTADDIDDLTIYDVVLPLPGHDVIYPENAVGDWYREHLKAEGMADPDFFHHKVRDYSLAGRYRKLLVKPTAVSWEQLAYDDVTVSLTLSDLELLKGVKPPTQVPDGKFQALKMAFSLPPSTYATMAIREILKCDTSAAYQSTLNVT